MSPSLSGPLSFAVTPDRINELLSSNCPIWILQPIFSFIFWPSNPILTSYNHLRFDSYHLWPPMLAIWFQISTLLYHVAFIHIFILSMFQECITLQHINPNQVSPSSIPVSLNRFNALSLHFNCVVLFSHCRLIMLYFIGTWKLLDWWLCSTTSTRVLSWVSPHCHVVASTIP
jgi:hypothetical protein